MEVDTLLLAEIVFIFVEKVSSQKRHFRIHGNIIKMFLSKLKEGIQWNVWQFYDGPLK